MSEVHIDKATLRPFRRICAEQQQLARNPPWQLRWSWSISPNTLRHLAHLLFRQHPSLHHNVVFFRNCLVHCLVQELPRSLWGNGPDYQAPSDLSSRYTGSQTIEVQEWELKCMILTVQYPSHQMSFQLDRKSQKRCFCWNHLHPHRRPFQGFEKMWRDLQGPSPRERQAKSNQWISLSS